MALQQVTVFVQNRKGALVDITATLAENNVNLRALSIADSQEFGILRLIVNDTETAVSALKEKQTKAQLRFFQRSTLQKQKL